MVKHFKLPDVGEGLTEAEIVKWHVSVGDAVEINQTIVEIETAKAIVELPCPFEGIVAELLVEEGQTVDVGTPIIGVSEEGDDPVPAEPGTVHAGEAAGAETPSAGIDTAGGSVEELHPSPPAERGTYYSPPPPGAPKPAVDEPKRTPVLVGYGVKPGATKRRPRKQSTTRPVTPARQTAPARTVPQGVEVLAKPPVRKLAKDLGVDLSTVTGTGPHGSITRDDVHASVTAQAPVAVAAPATAQAEREERIPVKGVRKATANAMVASAFSAPHVTEFLQVDVTETMNTVKRLKLLPEFAEVKVSPLLMVAKALLTAVRRHPMINASWDGTEIVLKRYVNLGIAVAADRGLMVPNIKDAHAQSMTELAQSLTDLATTARNGKSTPKDLSGGTITITNVGVFGVDAGTPILTPGEVAILAFGQIRDMPWVHEGEIKIRKVTTLSLSFDHRVVDGQLGSAVLRDVAAMLEDPARMLAWS